MKKNFLFTALILFGFGLFFMSCGEDDEDTTTGGGGGDECPVGEWTIPNNCPGEDAFITFFSSGSGFTTQPDCNNICAEPASITNFNWSTSGTTVTLNYTQIEICGDINPGGVPSPDNLSFSCSTDGSTLTINGQQWVSVGSGGGGSGSGAGGGTTTGQISFWTASQTLGGSYIDVTFNGSTQRISQFITSGTPDCGDNGTVTFTEDPGSYSWTAVGEDGTNWAGTNTIQENGCLTLELT